MLLGAVGCQKCDCKPCQACEAACDDTPAENFETVHVNVQGNENLTDGILEASGDTNPVPGYPGGSTGPYVQTITGSATLPSGRFPCYARLQLWRNVADEEPSGNPTKELDHQYVVVRCTAGKIRFGAFELSNGESVWITSDTTLTPPSPAPTYILESEGPIPLVGGDGDQSGSPPAFLGGTFAAQAVCVDPVDAYAGVSFSATIAWSEEAAYHVLYGRMVECYDELPPEDPGDCLDCDGTPTPAPDTVYLTISNFDGGGAVDANGDAINYDGTYAFDLDANGLSCARWTASLNVLPVVVGSGAVLTFSQITQTAAFFSAIANKPPPATSTAMYFAAFVSFSIESFLELVCDGTPISGSHSGDWRYISVLPITPTGYTVTFDWELST